MQTIDRRLNRTFTFAIRDNNLQLTLALLQVDSNLTNWDIYCHEVTIPKSTPPYQAYRGSGEVVNDAALSVFPQAIPLEFFGIDLSISHPHYSPFLRRSNIRRPQNFRRLRRTQWDRNRLARQEPSINTLATEDEVDEQRELHASRRRCQNVRSETLEALIIELIEEQFPGETPEGIPERHNLLPCLSNSIRLNDVVDERSTNYLLPTLQQLHSHTSLEPIYVASSLWFQPTICEGETDQDFDEYIDEA